MTDPQRTVRTVGDTGVIAGRGPAQMGWYDFAADHLVRGKQVLDVGCGMGKGAARMAENAASVVGQDLDPRLAGPHRIIGPVSAIESKSFDVVTCIDVVEHVEADDAFIADLARIARETVFYSTPNWTASRCEWPYHVREYTPRQFREKLEKFGAVTMLKGTPAGDEMWPVRHIGLYEIFNDWRSGAATSQFARAWNNVLPRPARIHSHIGAILTVRG